MEPIDGVFVVIFTFTTICMVLGVLRENWKYKYKRDHKR